MFDYHCSVRQLIVLAISIATINVAFSTYASTLALTSKSLCMSMQVEGFVKGCREGSPWAFEVTRHQEEFEFEPTNSEIFKCYTVSDGYTHIPCSFKGAIKQFASQEDLHAGLSHIRSQNYHANKQADLSANVTRADTTLEHYIFYKSEAAHTLVILPVTENMSATLNYLSKLGLVEVDE